jgi:hypothetical protein
MREHLIKAQYLPSGQYRVVCTCEAKFSHPLPGNAYKAWLAHRADALAEPEAVSQ